MGKNIIFTLSWVCCSVFCSGVLQYCRLLSCVLWRRNQPYIPTLTYGVFPPPFLLLSSPLCSRVRFCAEGGTGRGLRFGRAGRLSATDSSSRYLRRSTSKSH